MEKITYAIVKESKETVYYGMNQTAFIAFGHNGRHFLLTDGLNSCFNVLLVSKHAAIGSHVPPHPGTDFKDPAAGDKNVMKKMSEIAALYKKYPKFFPDPKEVALIYARFEGSIALPDKKELIEKSLRSLGLQFKTYQYKVKHVGEPRSGSHGTVFVDGRNRPQATIYLENNRIVTLPLAATMTSASSSSDHVRGGTSQSTQPETGRGGTMDLQAQTPQVYSNPLFPRNAHTISQSMSRSSIGISADRTDRSQMGNNPVGPRNNERTAPQSTSLAGSSEERSTDMRGMSRGRKQPNDASTAGMQHAVSRPDQQNPGARLVRNKDQWIRVSAKDWKMGKKQGKTILICDRLRIFTDP